MDWDPGVVTYSDDGGEPVHRFTFTLSKGEVEVFHIRAHTSQFKCDWTAELLLLVDGKRQAIYLDDDGEPFRTSARAGLPVWMWHGDQWEEPG